MQEARFFQAASCIIINQTIMKNKKPSIAIVACIHGDEIAGKKVIDTLKRDRSIRENVGFFVAHPEALKRRKRFIKQDLNRSFPGNSSGCIEERIAHNLKKQLSNFDIVIDLHTTSSNIDKLAIVTSLSTKMKRLLKLTPISKVALAYKKVFGGKEMIRYCRAGISLEYGPNKSGRNYRKILNDVRIMLKNIGLIKGVRKDFRRKEIYAISGIYRINKSSQPINSLKDFNLIKKGQVIARDKSGVPVLSDRDFYPLFVGKGRYPKTLALISSKRIQKL